jgi:hypothetical protein
MRLIIVQVCLLLVGMTGCQAESRSEGPAAQPAPVPAEAAAAQPTPPPSPATQPVSADQKALEPQPPAEPKYDEGPLKAVVDAIREVRTWYMDSAEHSAAESSFAMRLRLQGADIKRIVRLGNAILTEVVDDTGHAMVDPNTFSEQERKQMRPSPQVPPDQLARDGLRIGSKARLSARGARTIKHLRGSIRLILADEVEKYTVLNPLQFFGRTIEDPRLQALGLTVRIVPPEQFTQPLPPEKTIVLQFQTKADNVQSVSFFDGNMQPMRYRQTTVTTTAGEECQAFLFDGAAFNNEMQLVLEVHPVVQDVQLPIEADDVPLP